MSSAKETDRNCSKIVCGNWIFGFVVVLSLMHEIHSLKDVRAVVPLSVRTRDTVTLQCEFNLEKDTLYTVKWFKNSREFFRYIPKEDPQMHIFALPGINVDLSRSSMHEVVLLDIRPEISGRYKCEVTTDFPDFFTTMSTGYMFVINVPEGSPIMEITRANEKITANCTTPPSFPAMNVSWYVNGIRVPESSRRLVRLDPYAIQRETTSMTVSHLEKEIDENVFQGGVIRVQCIATLFNLYRSENVRYIDDNTPQPWQSSVSFTDYSGSSNRKQSATQIIVMLFQVVLFLLSRDN